MPNNQAHDPRVATAGERVAQAVGLSVAAVVAPSLPSGNIFSDDFESADFSATNGAGFQWPEGERPRVSIVRSDGYVVHNGVSAVSIGPLPEREWENNPDSSGTHALRLRYDSTDSGGENTEIRFDQGTDELNEVWYRWALKVPINYSHSTNSVAGGATNNKLAAFWMDGYEFLQDGPTCVLQMRNNGSNSSVLRNYFFQSAADGSSGEFDLADPEMLDDFLFGPADAGRWVYIAVHLKASTDDTTADGVYEIYKRFSNESAWTTMFQKQDCIFKKPAGFNGWKRGYIGGFANATYAQDTEFLLDDFHISTGSLL